MDTERIKIENTSFFPVVGIASLLMIFFSISAFLNSKESVEIHLQRRINPNLAEVSSLVRLPNIGLSKANKIIDHRRQNGYDNQVFNSLEDLQKVKGIGPKISGQLNEYLTFE